MMKYVSRYSVSKSTSEREREREREKERNGAKGREWIKYMNKMSLSNKNLRPSFKSHWHTILLFSEKVNALKSRINAMMVSKTRNISLRSF